MRNFFKRLLDGKDRTTELHSLLVIIAFFALLGFEAYNLFNGNAFDASEFGEAVGFIIGGGGIGAIGQAILNRGS